MDLDLIKRAAEPSVVPTGEVLRFELGYAASTNRDLHIDLFDSNTNYLASAVQPVVPGSGVCDMTISAPQVAPGEYFISAFIDAHWTILDPGRGLESTTERHDYRNGLPAMGRILLGNRAGKMIRFGPRTIRTATDASNAYES
jgi:hypothetical protein